ncbi:amino acid permease [Mycolicibacterium cyprinidarum]|uniref:Amino acid permease n=1 Tax=Mycolicibacterium cyprinidarum TaxID=2860311 RepID=A0ABQ4V5K5_9MYCO|nr:amino acid permease [Mycolicibacterium sp. NGTWSNA01]GJF12505.1 amino acid permease [Mycolicibacterium sp. NGTWS0302]
MPAPSTGLTEQMLRRRPAIDAPVAHGASAHLKRSIGTFQLTMFGVGATVGTGIFFVLAEAVPEAGPAVIISFVIAGVAAGLSAICYAEMASAVPVSGSSYSYAYTTLGEFVAMGIGACLLLEYGVSISAVAVGWSGYVNKLLDNLFGVQVPQLLSAAPWDDGAGLVNLPAVLLIVMCAALLIRGASESAVVNTIMVAIKLGVLLLFVVIALTAYNADHFAGFWDAGLSGITLAASGIFFSYIGLDAVSTAGDEVKDPQKTMPRAILAALIIVTSFYVLVAFAALGSQPTAEFGSEEQSTAGLAVILENITGSTWASTILAAGAVISIFSVALVVMYGQTRILFAMGRDGLLPSLFAKVNPRTMTPVNNTVIVAVVCSLLAGFVPLGSLLDMVSIGTLVAFITVSIGVIVLRVREPDLDRGFKVPFYPITPILSVLACLVVLWGLHWYTWIAFGAWVGVALVFWVFWSRHRSALNDGGDSK